MRQLSGVFLTWHLVSPCWATRRGRCPSRFFVFLEASHGHLATRRQLERLRQPGYFLDTLKRSCIVGFISISGLAEASACGNSAGLFRKLLTILFV